MYTHVLKCKHRLHSDVHTCVDRQIWIYLCCNNMHNKGLQEVKEPYRV